MERYPGQRQGSSRFHFDGFDYRADNTKLLRVKQFRCCKSKCKGRAQYSVGNSECVTVTKLHNHARNSSEFRTWRFREALRDRSVKELSTPISIIFRELSREYSDVAELVSPQRERKRMRRARSKMMPKVPESFSELGDLLMTDESVRSLFGMSDPLPGEVEKEQFFQKKIEGPHGTSLVFASPYLLQRCLKTTNKIKVDGTFKVLPRKPAGRQLFSIHARHGINTFPVIFCLMESKSKASYVALLKYIKEELLPGWEPTECMTDFEKALRAAMRSVFPNCCLIGCYFHYTQAVQKNWSQFGMMRLPIRLKEEARYFKSSVMALAFAEAKDICHIFESMDDDVSLALRAKAEPFISYFKKTWLSETDRHYKPEDFSVYGHADRTNNHVESFHSRLHEVHPNIWTFLSLLISITVESRQNFGRFCNGLDLTANISVKVLWNDERIVRARALYSAGRIDPRQFVNWCRTSTKNTLAIVRQGRRLRRLLRAENACMNYDEVATSSDSLASDNSFDFEYVPNDYLQDLAEREDEQADAELLEVHRAEEMETPSDVSVPDDNDSIWHLDEDEDLELIHASQMWEEPDNTPNVSVAMESIIVEERRPDACIVCVSAVATVVALPCRHALICEGCRPMHIQNCCDRCNEPIAQLFEIIPT